MTAADQQRMVDTRPIETAPLIVDRHARIAVGVGTPTIRPALKGSGMHSRRTLVRYLNTYWAQHFWSAGHDFIRDQIFAEAGWTLADSLGPAHGFTKMRSFFTSQPKVWQEPGAVRMRFPRLPTPAELVELRGRRVELAGQMFLPLDVYLEGIHTGYHALRADVTFTDPIPDPDLVIAFAIDITARGAAAPDVKVDFAVRTLNLPVFANVVLAAYLGIAAPAVANTVLDLAVAAVTGSSDERVTAYFENVGFQNGTAADLVHPAGATLIEPAQTVAGNKRVEHKYADPRAPGYIDILLVADGYRAAGGPRHIGEFRALARDLANDLCGPGATEPYASFRTALRIWQMPLVASNPGSRESRLALATTSGSRTLLGFANLARLAEVGLTARAHFGRDPLIVVVTRTTGSTEKEAASFAVGPYVLLNHSVCWDQCPTTTTCWNGHCPTGKHEHYRAVLLHELGHTYLGRGLADEYERPKRERDAHGRIRELPRHYYGPEPRKRNVSIAPRLLRASSEWGHWASTIGSGVSLTAHQGGYNFGSGIFRPEASCQMRNTGHLSAFCDVCAEQLVLGMTDLATDQYRRGMLDLEVSYQVFPDVIRLHLDQGAATSLPVYLRGVYATGAVADSSTRVTLRIFGASVALPGRVTWRVWRLNPVSWQDDVVHSVVEGSTDVAVDLVVKLGWRVEVEVATTTPLLGSQSSSPVLRATLNFDQPRTPVAADLRPPENPAQWVPWGQRVDLQVDQKDGSISWPGPAWLAADAGEVTGFNVPVDTLFMVTPGGADMRPYRVGPEAPGANVRVDLPVLWQGKYTWSVATIHQNVIGAPTATPPPGQGAIAFEVAPVNLNGPGAGPRSPMLPKVHHFPFTGQVLSLSAYSWHPGGRRIRFEFEVRDQGVAFTDQPTDSTGLLAPPHPKFHVDLEPRRPTAGVRGHVENPGNWGSGERFQVRVVDEDGQQTAWVTGPEIRRAAPSAGPFSQEELEEFQDGRLEDAARRLQDIGKLETPILAPRPLRPPLDRELGDLHSELDDRWRDG